MLLTRLGANVFDIAAELKGNQQAAELKAGVGSLGGLKKSL